MALRSSPSTIMTRVKPVIISKAAGRKGIMVSMASVWMLSDQVCEPFGPAVLVMAGTAWAQASDGRSRLIRARSSRPKRRAGKRSAVMMRSAGCTVLVQMSLEVRLRASRRRGVQQADLLRGDANQNFAVINLRSEERRVGKVWRSRWSAECWRKDD